jgi:hypothetical protein
VEELEPVVVAVAVAVIITEFDVVVTAVVEYHLRGNILTEYFLTNSAS